MRGITICFRAYEGKATFALPGAHDMPSHEEKLRLALVEAKCLTEFQALGPCRLACLIIVWAACSTGHSIMAKGFLMKHSVRLKFALF
eukprot:5276134-Pyramimonas_sp.AAC.1